METFESSSNRPTAPEANRPRVADNRKQKEESSSSKKPFEEIQATPTIETGDAETTTTITTGINDFPAGLLGRDLIQRYLPWRGRVQVERVCRRWQREALVYGWLDIKRLRWGEGEDGLRLAPPTWLPLLSRIGPHLATLDLYRNSGDDVALTGDALRVGLALCPNLKHLAVEWMYIAPAYGQQPGASAATLASPDNTNNSPDASRLKSLLLYKSHHSSSRPPLFLSRYPQKEEEVAQLSKAFRLFPSLEYLRIDGFGQDLQAWLSLPVVDSTSLRSNLRYLQLDVSSSLMNEMSFEELGSSLVSLRSLSLNPPFSVDSARAVGSNSLSQVLASRGVDPSFLRDLTLLEYLDIGLEEMHINNFVARVLPQLGCLKALDLQGNYSLPGLKLLIPALATHQPQLEHLGMWASEEALMGGMATEELRRMFAQLGRIRSFRLFASPYTTCWDGLEGMCQIWKQLEYLELDPIPPNVKLCNIVKDIKSLRALKLWRRPKWDPIYLGALAQAAATAEKEATQMLGGIQLKGCNVQGKKRLPPLRISYEGANRYSNDLIGKSRLQFVRPDEMESEVFHRYRYGCLSEGQPPFKG